MPQGAIENRMICARCVRPQITVCKPSPLYLHCGHFHLPIRSALPGVICEGRAVRQWQSPPQDLPSYWFLQSFLCPSWWHEEAYLDAFAIIPRVAKVTCDPEVAHPASRTATLRFVNSHSFHGQCTHAWVNLRRHEVVSG